MNKYADIMNPWVEKECRRLGVLRKWIKELERRGIVHEKVRKNQKNK